MKIIKNPNTDLVEMIEKALQFNKEKYGKEYCPCNINMNDDTVCMCKIFREKTTMGECPCGRFIKTE